MSTIASTTVSFVGTLPRLFADVKLDYLPDGFAVVNAHAPSWKVGVIGFYEYFEELVARGQGSHSKVRNCFDFSLVLQNSRIFIMIEGRIYRSEDKSEIL